MIDVIFPKRAPSARDRDLRPIPSDYQPRQLSTLDADGIGGDTYYEDLGGGPACLEGTHGMDDDSSRNRLNEIASLVRSLTYGEMIELARALWNLRGQDGLDQHSLPMTLHQWSTASAETGPSAGEAPDASAP